MKYTLVSVPALGNKQNTFSNLKSKLADYADTHQLLIPEFKIGTLDGLVLLSDDLVKFDAVFEQATNKIADILSILVKDQKVNVQDFLLVNDKTIDQYISSFQWNSMKYRTDKSLQETTTLLNQEVASIDNVMKTKMNTYTLNKNALLTLQRKQTGNLSVKSLNGIVKKQHCILNSEYITTLIVAVPRQLYKLWNNSYETLAPMVVPRSSVKIAEDDEFGLFTVTVFQRAAEDFAQKAREERFIVRDFKYDEDALKQQQGELEESKITVNEQQAELVRLARTNFGEVFGAWVHLKALRIFVESVLRYGLPPDFTAVSILALPKYEKKVDEVLVAQYGRLGGVHGQTSKAQAESEDILDHDLQTMNDNNYRPYVQFELLFDLERRQ
ncbi:hypothetical protein J3Q64DRAFT_1737404 [Phycomyces blakesleeanus]|uniref:V-type proton ATPase subunit C n=2 Tax=Phycomyces blakesleeanus TaxID=4837 RepID=A0A167LPY6_PHYB8|nr:hypothetical protein PHYBLDRAFT_187872 [Phycomyces blakesleeanus NRRL 1555(-)]OAD70876.1 hypothetical protein PHYBLDRAFT_187872 [Phycomyces blakesleeanus NRRL 1555(-)]|eukprot:XP_018288916.1 hypothetical protein PHYBLDRAFT_187872 [Phycomyces blakesleeanus NRRL 1555(-)]